MNRLHPCQVAIVAAIALMASACSSTPEPAAPPPEPPPLSSSFLQQLSADGLFAFGRASIEDFSADGRASLDDIARRVAEAHRPLDVVHVIGHSDRIGNDRANLRLSEQRANAVRDYLVTQGVPADRITAVGRGAVEPVVTCERERGQALVDCLAPNRRVELQVRFAD